MVLEGELLPIEIASPSSARIEAGDVLLGSPASGLRAGTSNLGKALLLIDTTGPILTAAEGERIDSVSRVIRLDDLVGRGIPGITGLRVLERSAYGTTLRLGPPPGARWVVVGLRVVVVHTGTLQLVDGDETLMVRAGQLAVVGDPSATLYLQAGNDAALATGFARSQLVAALA